MSELKQTVPQDAAIRERIRLAAAEYVQEAGLNPPLSLNLLTRHAEKMLVGLDLKGRGFDHYCMIELNNALWCSYFPHIARKQRLLLLPFCLRKQPECPAAHDDLGLICRGCGRCSIPRLSDEAESLDMPVLVAESSSAVADWVEQGEIQAVVGVSCLDSLEKSFPAMLRSAVPGIAVPLLRDGCRDTAFDPEDLNRALAVPQDTVLYEFSYGTARSRIDALFTPEGVSKFIPDNLLINSGTLHAWVWLNTGTYGGKTCYHAIIPLKQRGAITEVQPTPAQRDIIEQAIEALNNASVEQTTYTDDGEGNITITITRRENNG